MRDRRHQLQRIGLGDGLCRNGDIVSDNVDSLGDLFSAVRLQDDGGLYCLSDPGGANSRANRGGARDLDAHNVGNDSNARTGDCLGSDANAGASRRVLSRVGAQVVEVFWDTRYRALALNAWGRIGNVGCDCRCGLLCHGLGMIDGSRNDDVICHGLYYRADAGGDCGRGAGDSD
ncbi:hypothetical protein HG531_012099 [Fusarium graminearum]|nr:hypothetical protein HG531_012099 [Fusarium graminearum]